jgi:CMP-N,N'-diacetyllegionaminic acid synthase
LEALGLITARGGSISISKKSITPLMGRPLLAYTCDAALASTKLGRVVLSTDDEEIASVGRELGVEVPIMRPDELAKEDTLILPVIQHMVNWLTEHEGYTPDLLMLLQPTSPLRQAKHIDESIQLIEDSGADCVVSVTPVPHQFNPVSVLSIVDGVLEPFLPGEGGRVQRRQDKPPVYARNGPAVYLGRTQNLMKPDAHLYMGVCRPYIMETQHSIDIDSLEDLAHAELIISSQSSDG